MSCKSPLRHRNHFFAKVVQSVSPKWSKPFKYVEVVGPTSVVDTELELYKKQAGCYFIGEKRPKLLRLFRRRPKCLYIGKSERCLVSRVKSHDSGFLANIMRTRSPEVRTDLFVRFIPTQFNSTAKLERKLTWKLKPTYSKISFKKAEKEKFDRRKRIVRLAFAGCLGSCLVGTLIYWDV